MVSPPLVLFADLAPWACLLDFAAALRQRGVRVERVTVPPEGGRARLRNALQRLVYARVHPVLGVRADGSVDVHRLPHRRTPGLVGVEATDHVAAALASSPAWRDHPALSRCASAAQALLFDKLAVTRHAQAQGLAVPPTWERREQVPPVFPVVVKARLGSGGQGVRVVADAAALDLGFTQLGNRPDEVFAQAMVAGDVVQVGGVALRGELVQAAAYRSVSPGHDPHGPASEVEVVADPDLLREAARLLTSLEYTGSFCLDYVRNDDGSPLLIDVNARIFGSWLVLQQAGLDVVGAWLHVHGLGPRPEGVARPGYRGLVMQSNLALGPPRPLCDAVLQELAAIRRLGGLLGRRWQLTVAVEVLLSAGLHLARSGREAAPTERPTGLDGSWNPARP